MAEKPASRSETIKPGAREVAWSVLQAMTASAWAEELLPARLREAGLSEADSRLARELVFGVIKSRAYLDFCLQPLFKQPPSGPIRDLLRLGAYQVLMLDRIPDHAAVHATVELAKAKLPAPQVKFVNAVMRELLRRGRPTIPDQDPVRSAAIRFSLPEWLVRRWQQRWGLAAAEAMMAAANQAPPLVGRVLLEKISRDQAMARLRAAGAQVEPGGLPSAVRILAKGDPAGLPGFAEGWLYFQDEASQMIGYLVDPGPRQISLDFCSAPGGKTTHMAELAGPRSEIWAHDISPRKLALVKENAQRLQLTNIKVLKDLPAITQLQADRVLVDAPCSGLGTLRRHAEIRWRIAETDLTRLAKTQQDLLRQAAGYVKMGGHLIYSTCTTEPEENEHVVRAFLKAHPDFELQPGPGRTGLPAAAAWDAEGFFRTFPPAPEGEHAPDAMFAARLVRKAQLSFRFR